jgi:monovalent cation:proton antiporter-2 (CPA2) family protein
MILDLLYLLVAAVIFVPVFQRLGLGSVLGYLCAGLVIGPSVLGLISYVDAVRHIAELGVVFLLFVIGLELKPQRLWTMRMTVFGLGLSQVLLTGALLSGISYLLGMNPRPAIVVGFGLALSSTAFVLQLLAERGELATHQGRASFGILLLQDIAVVPLLAMIAVFAPRSGPVSTDVGLAILEGVGALAVVILAGRFAVRPVLRHIAGAGNVEVFTATAVLLVIGTGWLMEEVGLSMALGAFLAGVLLSGSEFRHQITADIEHFRGLLLGLFFMGVGMTVDLKLLASHILPVLGIVAGLLAVKIALIFPLTRAFGFTRQQSLSTALYLSQAGEFGFVLFGVAVNHQLLNDTQYNILILAIGMSMVTTPLMFSAGRWLNRRVRHDDVPEDLRAEQARPGEGAVLVAGFGRFGQQVARVLQGAGLTFIAVDNNVGRVMQAHDQGLPVYFGDASRVDVLHHLGADNARLIVITLDDKLAVDKTVQALRRNCPKVPIVARAKSTDDSRHLQNSGVDTTVPEALESSLQLAAVSLRKLSVSDADVNNLVNAFREEDYRQLRQDIAPSPD